jgi:hypothetical protein
MTFISYSMMQRYRWDSCAWEPSKIMWQRSASGNSASSARVAFIGSLALWVGFWALPYWLRVPRMYPLMVAQSLRRCFAYPPWSG